MINVYRVDNDYLNKFDGWNKIFKYFYYQDHIFICYIHVVNKDKQQVRSWYLSLPSQINSNPDQNRNIRSKVKIFCSAITGICCGTM